MPLSLFEAIETGDLDTVVKSLEACTSYEDLQQCDDSDETPLMKAAWVKTDNRKRILQLVWVKHLQLKGNLKEALSRKDDDGFTVLMHAALSEDDETLKLVLGFYKQVFDDLKFLKESISSAELPETEKKSLTKKIGNCLADLQPVKKAPTMNGNYDKNGEKSGTTPQVTSANGNASNRSSSVDEEEDADDEKTPKLANTQSARQKQSDVASDDDDDDDDASSTSSEASYEDGAAKEKDVPTAITLTSDVRDELLTTIKCMKTLAVPLHDAIRKGKAGPTELAKMESIMMLMGSMQDVLSPDAWQAI